MFRIIPLLILCVPLLGQADNGARDAAWILRGTVVTADGVIEDGAVRILGEKIAEVGPWAAPPDEVRVFEAGGTIYPGLIDLHNHLTWNVFPRWKAGRTFPNRYEWQQMAEYRMALDGPHRALIAEGFGRPMARYAEVKALTGGATSLAGLYPGDLPAGTAASYHQMMRMIDLCSGFYPSGTPEKILYEVFPLFMIEPLAARIRTDLKSHALQALLIHLGEGSPVDASSVAEYRMLKARGLLLPGVSLIHGVALREPEFQEMHQLGIGLIWSPHSNYALYGATADVAGALAAGVVVALAPDWSPTGSDGMLDELKYAAVWNESQPHPPLTDRLLFSMATVDAAKLAAVDDKIGSLKPGLYADLLVLDGGTGDPYAALDHASKAQVRMVMVSGKAVYGDDALVTRLNPEAHWVAVKVGTSVKSVALPVASPAEDWTHLTAALEKALDDAGTHLAPLSDD